MIVVVTMVQARDFPSAWSSIVPLGPQLGSHRRRLVLFNDDDGVHRELVDRLRELAHTEVITPGENLGVARGRNTLLSRALSLGATHVAAIDGDIYVPSDYLDRIEASLAVIDPSYGITAPTVLDFKGLARRHARDLDTAKAVSGDIDVTATTLEVTRWIEPDRVADFYHLGVRGWRRHYLTPGSLPGMAATEDLVRAGITGEGRSEAESPVWTFLASDPDARRLAADREPPTVVDVDTVAGGVSIYSARMLEEIGLCDERFSPFGFEDADLCIRARLAGYAVGWIPRAVLVHDFRSRSRSRRGQYLAFVTARSRALLASNHLDGASLLTQWLWFMSAFQLDAQEVARSRYSGPGAGPGDDMRLGVILSYTAGYLEGATSGSDGLPSFLDRLTRHVGGSITEGDRETRWLIARHRAPGSRARMTADVVRAVEDGDEVIDLALLVSHPLGMEFEALARFRYPVELVPGDVVLESFRCVVRDRGVAFSRLRAAAGGQGWGSVSETADTTTSHPIGRVGSELRRLLWTAEGPGMVSLAMTPPTAVPMKDFSVARRTGEFMAHFGVQIRSGREPDNGGSW